MQPPTPNHKLGVTKVNHFPLPSYIHLRAELKTVVISETWLYLNIYIYHDPARCFDETPNGTSHPKRLLSRIKPDTHIGTLATPFRPISGVEYTFFFPTFAKKHNISPTPNGCILFSCISWSNCLQSTWTPALRFLAAKHVVFCFHFPDKLLTNGGFVQGR